NHLRGSSGTFGDLRVIERSRDPVAIDLAGLLDSSFPEFERAIGSGRSTSGGEQECARELLFIGRLKLGAERIFRRQRLEVIEATRKPFDLGGLVDVKRVLVVVDARQPAAVLQESRLVELLEERPY